MAKERSVVAERTEIMALHAGVLRLGDEADYRMSTGQRAKVGVGAQAL